MSAERRRGSLHGARVALTGEFACGLSREAIERIVATLGGVPCVLDDPAVTHVVRGDVTARLVATLGAPPAERARAADARVVWLDESALEAACREATGVGLVALAGARDRASADSIAALRAALLDPACVAPDERRRLANALAERREPAALDALADVLSHTRGALGEHEARAFGQLVASGVTRFARRAPIAIECPLGRTHAPDAILALATQAGSPERYTDDEGRAWLRVRCADVPRLLRDTRLAEVTRVPFFALLRAAGRRRRARVWLAGCALPADLAWSSWLAMFG